MRIELLEETVSTNVYIRKYLSGGENVIVCAQRQTGGKGTKGRSFLSAEGGVYLSALTFYHNVPANEAFRVMTHAAVSVCRTAEAFSAAPEIKWPNDIYLHGRKLCGILIENGISEGRLRWSIVGIGLNVNNDVSSLCGIASSLSEVAGTLSVARVRDTLIGMLQKQDTREDYLSYVRFLGKELSVTEGEATYRAKACAILEDGRLEIEQNGKRRALSAAEISVKL